MMVVCILSSYAVSIAERALALPVLLTSVKSGLGVALPIAF
jgi:hypothetical protein